MDPLAAGGQHPGQVFEGGADEPGVVRLRTRGVGSGRKELAADEKEGGGRCPSLNFVKELA